MKLQIIPGVLASIFTLSSLAKGECSGPPVGGSENSAGTSFYEGLAIWAFVTALK